MPVTSKKGGVAYKPTEAGVACKPASPNKKGMVYVTLKESK